MNKRNFKKVLTFIEQNPWEWQQSSCQQCFLVHALRILVPNSRARSPYLSPTLAKRLGLTQNDLGKLYWAGNTLADFHTFMRKGKVEYSK